MLQHHYSAKKTFAVTVVIAEEAKQVVIKEMDHMDSLIKSTPYTRESDDDFILEPNTSYIIVEELMTDDHNSPYINRNIYNPIDTPGVSEKPSHACRFPDDNGVIGAKLIRFVQ